MRKKLYFGSNFKMYKGVKETNDYLTEITEKTSDIDRKKVQFFFIPSFTSLTDASRHPYRDKFMLGAQNMCWEEEGQFTGEISPVMLEELGLDMVLIGHSERRHIFNETDMTENKKVLAALKHNFTVLLCVGETAEEKDYRIGLETLRKQLIVGLHNVKPEQAEKIWIAYEPVWSIGINGTPAPADYAGRMHTLIRRCLIDLLGKTGQNIPLLYGGSVNPDNANKLIVQPDINGLFTTRTAFQIDKFSKMIRQSIEEYERF